eukprot:SAG22_NODE_452_length_10341_cov_12.146065_8_plen_57_part_00
MHACIEQDASLSHLRRNPSPGQYYSQALESRAWLQAGAGRGGFGSGFIQNNERFRA